MKNKNISKAVAFSLTLVMVGGIVSPSIANADTIKNKTKVNEIVQNNIINVDSSSEENKIANAELDKIINEASSIVIEKYSRPNTLKMSSNGEYILTAEDEERAEKAVNEYFEIIESKLNQRGLGDIVLNRVGVVAAAIDIALIAAGIVSSGVAASQIKTILRANRTNITRVVEKTILAKVGISVGSVVGAAIDIALVIVGTSLGEIIAKGLDRVDGRNDGLIFG